MKKIVISLAALGALSTVAFAGDNRSWDLRDAEYYTTQGYVGAAAATTGETAAFAVIADGKSGNFARLQMNMEKNELNSH
jgi:hypothetical protein